MYIADLHIHSRFSRATSRDCDLAHLDWWARRKGIRLLGTGDFTHPAWRAELKEQLVPAGEGVYRLREELRLPGAPAGEPPLFIITGEISSISVSYTHLKDQRRSEKRAANIAGDIGRAGEYVDDQVAQRQRDVYKRQCRARSARGCSPAPDRG